MTILRRFGRGLRGRRTAATNRKPWAPLAEAFVDELRGVLGGRTEIVHARL